MPKTLSCRDVGVDCDFQATGNTNEEILAKAAEHAKTAHGFDDIPRESGGLTGARIASPTFRNWSPTFTQQWDCSWCQIRHYPACSPYPVRLARNTRHE